MSRLARLIFRCEYGRIGFFECAFTCWLWFNIVKNSGLNEYLSLGLRGTIFLIFAYLATSTFHPDMVKAHVLKIVHWFSTASLAALLYLHWDDAYANLLELIS